MPEAKNRLLRFWVTAGILLAFVGIDYATPQVLYAHRGPDSQWPIALVLGACIAQVTLIAVWAVFAPGNIVVRLPWSLLLGLVMWYVLTISSRSVQTYYSPYQESGIAELGINLLLGITALQVPLWIAKRTFRYRMLAPGETAAPTTTERFQFQIKHMLIGTLVLALALSPLRIVIPGSILQHLRLEWQMFFAVGVVIVANLLTTLPCLWGGFVSNAKLIPLGFGWLFYCLFITGLEIEMIFAVERGGPNWGEAFGLTYLVNVTQGALVFGVMRGYRALGYRMVRAPRHMPSAEQLQETWEAVLVEPEADSNEEKRDVE